MSMNFARSSAAHRLHSFPAPQPQRLRASWKAFEILCDFASERAGDAQLLLHATKEGLEPHPLVAADVLQALRAAYTLCLEREERGATSKRTSTVDARSGYFAADDIAKVIRLFEAAFLR